VRPERVTSGRTQFELDDGDNDDEDDDRQDVYTSVEMRSA